MTKSTITREESVQAIFDLKVGYRLGFADIEILKRVARMALAAMDSEPVAWQWRLVDLATGEPGDWRVVLSPRKPGKGAMYRTEVIPLYRHAQPVPLISEVSPLISELSAPIALDDLLSMAASAIEDLLEHTDPNTSYYSGVWADVPGKLRAAAMLQAGNSPVIPVGYVMVPKEPTEAMILSAMRDNETGGVAEIYELMLAAAPQEVK